MAGADRQYWYRKQHPQINVTFRNVEEYRSIKQASTRTGSTPREVLLDWAQRVLAEPKSSSVR
ncbi:MAG: hypothetical protein M0Z41_13545 [Peptococcaceae bacterium]|jgi:hypothetical protein|nr:hypothetical protein [Peptococcaceae bacterium]